MMNKIIKIKLTEDRQSNLDIIEFLGKKKNIHVCILEIL